MNNPFSDGGGNRRKISPTILVIFGATGDLAHRKLFPGLYDLFLTKMLPAKFVILGASRTKYDDNGFRDKVGESLKKYSKGAVDEKICQEFLKNIYYQPTDAMVAEDYELLAGRLSSVKKEYSAEFNHLYYLATSPRFFGEIASRLDGAKLVQKDGNSPLSTSLIVEKPFGHDLPSARKLNSVLRKHFSERQIFRIDHYLGKETVQNILVFRFSNGIFEPLWNHKYIDHIQISVCESIGVGNRAPYFDKAGIVRDIVQNHILQMLSLICIEPPISLSDADSIRDEKVKVLRCIKRLRREDIAHATVRGQYQSGYIAGEKVAGYLDERGIAKSSTTDTFAALRVEIDNWRWAGVPIYIRAGKRLPRKVTDITLSFRRAPDSLFRGSPIGELEDNLLTIRVQPNEGISLKVNSKPPGQHLQVRPVVMDFLYGESFGAPSSDAYERLLLDAMRGDATLFTRDDEIEQAWDLLAPVLEEWEKADSAIPVASYEAGEWGPTEASELLRRDGREWKML